MLFPPQVLVERDEAQLVASEARAMQESAKSAMCALKADLDDAHARMRAERLESEAMALTLDERTVQLESVQFAYAMLEDSRLTHEAQLHDQMQGLATTNQVLQVRMGPRGLHPLPRYRAGLATAL